MPLSDIDTAYLFECRDDAEYLAVTRDRQGSNLPRFCCPCGWKLRTAFSLGVEHVVPVAIAPEPILRGLRDRGYYVWRHANTVDARLGDIAPGLLARTRAEMACQILGAGGRAVEEADLADANKAHATSQ
jgi:hypothetical protein